MICADKEPRSARPNRRRGLRKWCLTFLLLAAVSAVVGCQTLSFYGQAIKGQYQLVIHRRSIKKILADPATAPDLKNQLELVERLRAFAQKDLKLPVDSHYQAYVDVHRAFVVWNVEAAPEFSMEPKTWWYPFIGRQEYRGYFREQRAIDYAARLKREGFDVAVGGATAYSTLGWFEDPLLSTFLFEPESDLAETLFHELGHQRVFAASDTDFNEAFATTVGEEGARRWLRAKGDEAAYQKYVAEIEHTRQFARLIADTRLRLESLYGDKRNEQGTVTAVPKPAAPTDQLRKEKQRILDDLQQQYQRLKTQWGGATNYDRWFSRQLNNARLNSVATYYDLVPSFERMLESSGGDLEKFYSAVEQLAKLPKKDRHQRLQN
jgi:predicted aminopeptidase